MINIDKNITLLQAEEIIEQRKLSAEAEVLKNEEKLDKIPEYVSVWNKKGALTIEIAEKLYKDEDVNDLIKELELTKKELVKIAEKNGITQQMLKPNFSCKICGDTGYVNEEKCVCLKKVYNSLLMKESNINLEDYDNIDLINKDYYNGENAKKIIEKLRLINQKFDITPVNNIVLTGACGVGKTYVMKSFAKSVLEQDKTVLYLTAFNLNNLFLEMLTSDFDRKMKILKQLLDVDLLLIDDLGTEPIYKNVTIENLYTIVDERLNRNKKIMITTNLLPQEIKERYDVRIYGRLYQKEKTLSMKFDGDNLREKN